MPIRPPASVLSLLIVTLLTGKLDVSIIISISKMSITFLNQKIVRRVKIQNLNGPLSTYTNSCNFDLDIVGRFFTIVLTAVLFGTMTSCGC